MSVEIQTNATKHHHLVVDGWQVPGVEAFEEDGGRVLFLVDRRMGYSVAAADFEAVARLVADAIGHTAGYGAHPREDLTPDERHRLFASVTHPLLQPTRVVEISAHTTNNA